VIGAGIAGLIVSALAATTQAVATPAAPPQRRVDLAVSIGFMNLEQKTGSYPRGFEPATAFLTVTGGYNWDEHWKTDAGVAWTSRSDIYEEQLWDTPEYFDRVLLLHDSRLVRTSAAQVYVFGHGRFRPYVGGGFGIDVDTNHDSRSDNLELPLTEERRLLYTESGIVLTPVDRLPCEPQPSAPGTLSCGLPNADQRTVQGFGFATVGFKAYSPAPKRLFVALQAQIGSRAVTNLTVGVGFSF
jgi:hypothetical protein